MNILIYNLYAFINSNKIHHSSYALYLCTYILLIITRSGWSGFNRTTFQKESNEYSVITTQFSWFFKCMQSICSLGHAGTCWRSLWWKWMSFCQCSPISPIIPREDLHYSNNCSGNQNRWCALHRVIGLVAGHFCTTVKVKMLCFAALIFSVSCMFRAWSSTMHLIFSNTNLPFLKSWLSRFCILSFWKQIFGVKAEEFTCVK